MSQFIQRIYHSAFIAITFHIVSAAAASKQWLRNTNYDNPANWNVGRLPCPTDQIIFADPSPVIMLASPMTTIELVLPSNGQFMLGDGFSIAAANQSGSSQRRRSARSDTVSQGQRSTGSCNSSEEVRFNRTLPEDWFNPDNWCETSAGEACAEPQTARLDTERVPCLNDDVIFPPQKSFLIAFNASVKVKSVTIAHRSYGASNISEYLQSLSGRKQFQFVSDATMTLTGESCTDSTGCACGNDGGDLLQRICALKKSTCPPHFCGAALTPKGHCCLLCGAVMTTEYGPGFNFETLRSTLNTKFSRNNIELIISKTGGDRIQIVVTDTQNDGEDAKRQSTDIFAFIKRDVRDLKTLGLTDISIRNSGKGASVTAKQTGSKNSHAASIAGIVISIIIVILIIALAMYCFVDRSQCKRLRNKIPKSITFRRFSSNDGESVEMGQAPVSYVDIMNRMEQQTTFDNPMFDLNDSKDGAADINDNATGGGINPSANEKLGSTNNNDEPAVLDASSIPFGRGAKETFPGAMKRGNSFSNPLFGNGGSDSDYLDDSVNISAVYHAGDIDDSTI